MKMPPMPPKPVLIGFVVVLLVALVLAVTGLWKPLIGLVVGLFGLGAAAKSGKIVSRARGTITESTEEHRETTEDLNARQAERAAADEAAVDEALADTGPIEAVPDDSAREQLRAKLKRNKWGRG